MSVGSIRQICLVQRLVPISGLQNPLPKVVVAEVKEEPVMRKAPLDNIADVGRGTQSGRAYPLLQKIAPVLRGVLPTQLIV